MKSDTDIGRIRENLEELSRRLFTKKYRLEIAAMVSAIEPPVWPRQVARILNVGENQAASELAEFEKLGALQRFPSEFDRRKLYLVVPHWLWACAREALESEIWAMNPETGEGLVAEYWSAMLNGEEPQPILDGRTERERQQGRLR